MATRWAIRCMPGGPLTDHKTGNQITFDSYEAAEAEAHRLTLQAYANPRVFPRLPYEGSIFTPVLVDAAGKIVSEDATR